ncbi:MAG: hypothetical protein ACJ0KD_04065 [Dehalococcoidia bacterium]
MASNFCPECANGIIENSKFCSTCGIAIPGAPKSTPKPQKVKEPRPILFSLSEKWVNNDTALGITVFSAISFVILVFIERLAGTGDPYELGGNRDWALTFWLGFGFFACAIVRLLKQEFGIAFFAFASFGGLVMFWSIEEAIYDLGTGTDITMLIASMAIGILVTFGWDSRNAK